MYRRSEKAVTLIALVITIIVLMILLGISVSAITGRKGVIWQAKEAKSAEELEEIRENIGLAYLKAESGKRRRNEDLSSKIKNELDKTYGSENVTVTIGDDGKTYDVMVNGNKFIIDGNGDIDLKSGLTLSEHSIILNPNLGQITSNLTATLESDVTGNITWESSNSSAVSVTPTDGNEKSAVVKAEADSGTATITAKIDGTQHYDKCTVKVSSNSTIIEIRSDTNGCTVSPTSSVVVAGDTLGLTATPATGYTFKGWYVGNSSSAISTSASYTYRVPSDISYESSITITGKFEPVTYTVTYTVTYNANTGSGSMNAGTKTYGVGYTIANNSFTAPTGKVFKEWNTSANGTGTSYSEGESYNENEDVTLYAIWQDKHYEIAYNANTGSGSMNAGTKTYGVGYTIANNSFTAPTGKSFKEWNTASNGSGTSYSEGQSYTENEDVTLYAIWEDQTFTVTYNANSGSGTMNVGTKTYGVGYQVANNSFTAPTGKEFKNWNTKADGTGTNYNEAATYNENEDVTLYAIWEDQTFTVTYNANSGSGTMNAGTKTYGVGYQVANNSFTAPTGKEFKNWNTKADGSGTNYSEGQTYNTNADVTLYAIWEDLTYTITYNANSGSGTMDAGTKTYGVNYTIANNSFTAPTGKEFKNWNTKADGTGTNYNEAATYNENEDVTLYAIWEDLTYTITYNANTGSGTMNAGTKTYGVGYQVANNSFTAPTGKEFKTWNTKADGTGTNYSEGQSYNENEDVTLYAIWEDLTYTITYNANSGSGSMNAGTKTYGVGYQVANNSFTAPTGKEFKEWNTESNGSGTSYSEGQSYTENEDVTLYAIWEDLTYTVTYNANTGSGSMNAGTKTYGIDYAVAVNSFTAPTGKVFKEWNTSANGTGTSYSEGATYNTNADLTLYAIWGNLSEIPEGVNSETYGGYVQNYGIDLGIDGDFDSTDEGAADDWRVFYDDGENIYIIAADYVRANNTYLATAISNMGAVTYNSSYPYRVYWSSTTFKANKGGNGFSASNGAADIFSANRPAGTAYLEGKGFLGHWKGKTETSSEPNAKMTACLMDTKVWEGLAGGIPSSVLSTLPNDNKTAYAIGGPTLSMFIESWNKVKTTQLYYNNATATGYYVGTDPTPTSPYVDLSTNSDYVNVASTGDLYFPRKSAISNCSGYWLASPSAGDADCEVNVYCNGYVNYNAYISSYYGVRPVVCLPSSVKLEETSTGSGVYNIVNPNFNFITYNANTGTGSMSDGIKAKGQDYTIAANGFTAPSGMKFKCWNTESNGTGTSYSEGQTYNTNADVTLYAIWEDLTYTITYNANSGSGTMNAGTKTYGVGYQVANNSFTAPTGKEFKNWNTKADGSGTNYSEGQTYSENEDVTLYAQWENLSEIPEGVNAERYGGYVQNYGIDLGIDGDFDSRDEGAADDWRVFYDDGKNIYIIAADYVKSNNTYIAAAMTNMGATGYGSSYQYRVMWANDTSFKTFKGSTTESTPANGAADIFSTYRPTGTEYLEGKGFLGHWKGKTTTSSEPNAKMTASLMDTKVWEGFAGGIPSSVLSTLPNDNKTAYAIGGPTLSMFVESWNKVKTTQLYYNNATETGYHVGTAPTPTSTYVDLSTNSDYVNAASTGDLYFPRKSDISNCNGYWLASPSVDRR